MGHSRPMHSTPVPTIVRCCSVSDQNVATPRTQRCAISRQWGQYRPLVILLISDGAFTAAALTKSRVRLSELPGPGPPPSKSRSASTFARDPSWAIARWLSCGTISPDPAMPVIDFDPTRDQFNSFTYSRFHI
jgi:hypothetical protein